MQHFGYLVTKRKLEEEDSFEDHVNRASVSGASWRLRAPPYPPSSFLLPTAACLLTLCSLLGPPHMPLSLLPPPPLSPAYCRRRRLWRRWATPTCAACSKGTSSRCACPLVCALQGSVCACHVRCAVWFSLCLPWHVCSVRATAATAATAACDCCHMGDPPVPGFAVTVSPAPHPLSAAGAQGILHCGSGFLRGCAAATDRAAQHPRRPHQGHAWHALSWAACAACRLGMLTNQLHCRRCPAQAPATYNLTACNSLLTASTAAWQQACCAAMPQFG